jgi:hypothetical protein
MWVSGGSSARPEPGLHHGDVRSRSLQHRMVGVCIELANRVGKSRIRRIGGTETVTSRAYTHTNQKPLRFIL